MSAMLSSRADTQFALAATSAKPQGRVIVAFHSFSKEVMDPALDGTPGLPYRGQMFDWFISAMPEGKLTTDYGALERYESNADATVWTLVLRKGIRWHDGVDMTADDLKFTVEHYARPSTQCTQCGAVRGNLDHVEVIDRHTIRLHLKKPDANLPAAFGPLEGDLQILPKHYFDTVACQDSRRNRPAAVPGHTSSDPRPQTSGLSHSQLYCIISSKIKQLCRTLGSLLTFRQKLLNFIVRNLLDLAKG